MTKSHDRPKRQKRRPKDFAERAEKPEPREPPKAAPVGDVPDELMAALYGPNWRDRP